MSLGTLITILVGVFALALIYSVLLESLLGYRKERRLRNHRRVVELRRSERRQSPFPWGGPENRNRERRYIQRRVLDRRSEIRTEAA